jgi:carbonic anhydrase/acetyltransferase-like protein (isoleucine patch superfamily)
LDGSDDQSIDVSLIRLSGAYTKMKLRYLDFETAIAEPSEIAETAALIGRLRTGARLTMHAYATLRADGEHIRIGDNVYFGEHATVHIVDAKIGTVVGNEVTVGRYGVVHGCTLADHVVVGEGAAVLDGASVGPFAVIASDSIVPPRKKLAGGFLYAGVPAQPVRELSADEVAAIARSIRNAAAMADVRSRGVPSLRSEASAQSSAPSSSSMGARSPTSYIAPTARLTGEVRLGDDTGIYFGCVVDAGNGRIVIGPRSNVQDNSFLLASRRSGDLVLGSGVTVGHNVQMGSGTFGDDCLVGMMSRVADGVTAEPGSCIAAGAWVEAGAVVKSGWIWAGRPARPFRELRPEERAEFARGRDVYIEYGAGYRAGD